MTYYTYDGFNRLSRTYFPDKLSAGNWSAADYEEYTYDPAGNMLTKRTRRGDVIEYAYDALQRQVARKVPGAPVLNSTRQTGALSNAATHITLWDAASRKIDERHDWVTRRYWYDGAGRLTKEDTNYGRMVTEYDYDPAGNLTQFTYPDGFEVQYGYDALNRVVTAHEGDDLTANHVQGRLLASVSYDALSRRTGLTYGNGDARSFSYSTRGDLTGLDVLLGSAALPATRSFGWAFTHNGVGQVLSNSLDSEPGLWWSPPTSKLENYASNGLNQYGSVTAADGSSTTMSYDGNGNMVLGPVPGTFNYTAENELRNIWGNPAGTINYRYFPNGTRKSKTVNGVATSFWYWGDQEIMETDTGAITNTPDVLRRYVRLPGSIDEAFLMFDYSGSQMEEHWVHTDRLGSTVMTTDETGNVRERFNYDPYGNHGNTATGFPFRFTGQKLDPETGLMYYKARYYSPEIGRFLQVDPIGYADQQNLYAYVHNDPLNNTDPTGRECVSQEDGSSLCDPPGDDIGEFTIPADFAPGDIGPDQSGYHEYGAEASTPDVDGSLEDALIAEVTANPTPGNDSPATPEGVINDAGISPPLPGDDKVVSYVTTDSNGNTVVVNVTVQGQHGLHPGYVAQAIIPGETRSRIVVVGEGNARLQQGPGSALGGAVFQQKINGDMRRAIYKSAQ